MCVCVCVCVCARARIIPVYTVIIAACVCACVCVCVCDSLGCLEGDGKVPPGVVGSQIVIGDLVRHEGMEDGTECKAIRPALTEILYVHILTVGKVERANYLEHA